MGCGSGIISVFAASNDAECIASDINPMAVKSTIENAALNGFKDKITAVESDLFENSFLFHFPLESAEVGGQAGRLFDIIFFNPPYYKGNPKNNFERAFKAGESLEVIKKFAEQAKNFLAPGGVIYMIISSDADIDLIQQMFILHKFNPEIVTKINKFFETFYIVKIVL